MQEGSAIGFLTVFFVANSLEKEIEHALGTERMKAVAKSVYSALARAELSANGKDKLEYEALLLELIRDATNQAIAALPQKARPSFHEVADDESGRRVTPSFYFWEAISGIEGSEDERRAVRLIAAAMLSVRLWTLLKSLAIGELASNLYATRHEGRVAVKKRMPRPLAGFRAEEIRTAASSIRAAIPMFEEGASLTEKGCCSLAEAVAILELHRPSCFAILGGERKWQVEEAVRKEKQALSDSDADLRLRCRMALGLIIRLLDEVLAQNA
jgi:hypothetical protein